jgi:hypothetical protein
MPRGAWGRGAPSTSATPPTPPPPATTWAGLATAKPHHHAAAAKVQSHARSHFSRAHDYWKPHDSAPRAAASGGAAAAAAAPKRRMVPLAKPTREELGSLDLAASRLWDLDTNRLVDGVHYRLDVGGAHRAFTDHDAAENPLFEFLDPSVLDPAIAEAHPTFTSFYQLLDNYEREIGVEEDITREELYEENVFLIQIMKTAPMQYCFSYLLKKGKLNRKQRSERGFRDMLRDLWFKMYR